jgi:hypothetical protein
VQLCNRENRAVMQSRSGGNLVAVYTNVYEDGEVDVWRVLGSVDTSRMSMNGCMGVCRRTGVHSCIRNCASRYRVLMQTCCRCEGLCRRVGVQVCMRVYGHESIKV